MKPWKLNKFQKWLYKTFIFKGQYISFKDIGRLDLFWNIVSWYHFFNFKFKNGNAILAWRNSSSETGVLSVWNEATFELLCCVHFSYTVCKIIQVGEELETYKYDDNCIITKL